MSVDPSLLPAGEEAVVAATGRGWEAWFAELDAAGAAEWPHRDIARWIGGRHPEVFGWWAQNLTVGYERARGLRAVNEKADGYSANRSRTFPVPLDALYAAWVDDAARASWLGDAPHAVRGGTPGRSLNLDWGGDGERVRAWFTSRDSGKSAVSVQHERLADADAVEAAKEAWGAALDRLQAFLRT